MEENEGFCQQSAEPYILHENQEVRLKLRKEQLDLFKKKMKTGEINVHKEIVTKKRTIVVPVICEELVIENVMNAQEQNNSGQRQTIRIPLSEERIEVIKHPARLAAVSIYKQQYQMVEHVKSTLKKEKLKIEVNGSAKVKNTKS